MERISELTVLRVVSMLCATIIVIVGASVAKRTVNTTHDSRWWVVAGGFAVSALTVWAGVLLYSQDFFIGY